MSKSKVKISDVVIAELVKHRIDTVFGVTGGAVVHFFDSISRTNGIKPVFLNHEQAAAFAVEAYAKARKSLGAGIFTTGPGGTNALTGLAAAWLDSIPCIFISGQARTNQTIRGRNLRQVGTQELDVVSMVKSVTKYAVTVYDITEVKYHVQKAIYLATHGRPGPTWIDIPVDISWSYVAPEDLLEYEPEIEDAKDFSSIGILDSQVKKVGELLRSSQRPVILAGYGARLANCEAQLRSLVEKYQIPLVTTWNMADWIPSEHPLNIGRPGLSGQRGANLVLQNSDLILSIGSHLNSTLIGTRPEFFARDARIVVVDIDPNELEHCPIPLELQIQADAKIVVEKLYEELDGGWTFEKSPSNWMNLCARYKALNRIGPQYRDTTDKVNTYFFKDLLSEISEPGDLFVADGGGTIVYSSFQSIQVKERQRLILSTGLCSMGSGIPEAIGVHFAIPDQRIFCFVGDGSLPFNMQDLQIIRDLNIPIQLFVFNNEGYVSIRTTQRDFLEGRMSGSSPPSGLHLPNAGKVANAFDLPYFLIEDQKNLEAELNEIVMHKGPLICEVMVSPEQEIVPRQGFIAKGDGTFEPRPLEDMYPLLDRNILKSLMVVPELAPAEVSLRGREINLLRSYPRTRRPFEQRARDKRAKSGYVGLDEYGNLVNDALFEQLILDREQKFGQSYFDGDRAHGYGGYRYDKKYWSGVAKDIVETYELKAGDAILEIGCAKGFLLHDLAQLVPGLVIKGLDLSEYAVEHALPSVRQHISVGDAQTLPFSSNTFDLVLAINTLSELPIQSCRKALKEIGRVSKGMQFVTLNSWRNRRERELLLKWNLSALSNYSVNEWKTILSDVGYEGDYYWFFAC